MKPRLDLVAALWLLVALVALIEAAWIDPRIDLSFALPRNGSLDERVAAAILAHGAERSPLVIGIRASPPNELRRLTEELAAALGASGAFDYVLNGSMDSARPALESLFEWRYVLNPPLTAEDFAPPRLRAHIQTTLANLTTAEGALLRSLVPADPTGRSVQLLRSVAPGAAAPGLWLTADESMAVLLAGPRAPAPLDTVRAAFAQLDNVGGAELILTGPVAFAAEGTAAVRGEIVRLALLSAAAVAIIAVLAFRSVLVLAVLALPAALGVAAGAAAVQLVYGEVNGLTLAFGSTVFGIAVDYPIHMLSHTLPTRPLRQSAALLWRTVFLGILTAAAAFLPITVSEFPGLGQLGLFAIVGLIASGVASRWILAHTLPAYVSPPPAAAWQRIGAARRSPIAVGLAGVALLAASAFLILRPIPWQNDLLALSPITTERLALDAALRAAVSPADTRYALAVRADTAEEVLQTWEAHQPAVQRLVQAGAAAAFAAPADLLPSAASQRARQVQLPDAATLRADLAVATDGLLLRPGALDPFLTAVAHNKTMAPITPTTFAAAGAGWLLGPLLFEADGGWIGLGIPSQPTDAAALRSAAAALPGVSFVDLRASLAGLTERFRAEGLFWLPAGFALGVAMLAVLLRSVSAAIRTAVPVVAAAAVATALLVALGEQLSLFHLLALLLVGGLAVDYALVLGLHGEDDAGLSLRGLFLSAITTVVPFTALSFSQVPVLHQIGLTVAIGTTLSFAFAYLVQRQRHG